VNYRDVFFFCVFPLGLQLHFYFFAFCEDEHAGSPLVEAVNGENFVSRFVIAFAHVIGQDVLGGSGFVCFCLDSQQSRGFVDYEEIIIFVEDLQVFWQMSICRTFFLWHILFRADFSVVFYKKSYKTDRNEFYI